MIVYVAHQKGGVGKSTVSINVAYILAKMLKDIAILDLDSQHSSKLFNELRKQNDLNCVDCFTANDIDFNLFISKYKGNKENILIVDSGGYDNDVNRSALVKADIIITPVGISQIEIFGLQKFRNILKEASIAMDKNIKTHILLNNVDPRSKKSIESLQEYIQENNKHFILLDTVLHSRADYKTSYGEGLTVGELNQNSKATQEIKALSNEIFNLVLK